MQNRDYQLKTDLYPLLVDIYMNVNKKRLRVNQPSVFYL